jgi:hypothetical protein
MTTRAELIKQIEKAERNKISLYYLTSTEAANEVKKGNETINVLYTLLIQEINKHNAIIKRKVSSIRSQGTSD